MTSSSNNNKREWIESCSHGFVSLLICGVKARVGALRTMYRLPSSWHMFVKLVPMPDADFPGFAERATSAYAGEKATAGEWSVDDAIHRARAELENHLPDGISSAANHLFVLESSHGLRVGELWVAERQLAGRSVAMIMDLYIEPQQRRRGFGRASLLAVESLARQLGCQEVRLHVFGHNIAARNLYESLNYQVKSISMAKPL